MYRTMRMTGCLVGAMLLVATPTMAGDEAGMAEMIESWEAAWNAGDIEAIATHYTEDAIRMPYQAETVQGRAAIIELSQAFLDAGVTNIDLEVTSSEASGDMAWTRGTYSLSDADGNHVQDGKWMNVCRMVDGEWKIAADIWNTNQPDMAAEE